MTEVKNFYLSKCPVKYKKEIAEIFGEMYSWEKNTTTNKKEYLVSPQPIRSYSTEECRCRVNSQPLATINLEHSPRDISSPNGHIYVCNVKIWNNPETAKKLAEFFTKKKMLVDIMDSDV